VSGCSHHRRRKQRQSASAKSPEELVASCLAVGFRGSEERQKLRRATRLTDDQIESALLSPILDALLRDVQQAWVRERWPALLQRLFNGARNGESWAWRVLLEATGLGEQLRAATAAPPQEEGEAFVSSGFERRLLEDLRRGGNVVVPAGPAPSASG
jgi:hypothetical protein